jgi:hypothetical protein
MEGGFHEMSDGFHGISDGFHTISRWIPWNGRWIPWNGRWIPYLFQMDSIPFPGWSPYGIHVISSWNHNFTLVPHHFQSGFHMESIEIYLITKLNLFYYMNCFREGGWRRGGE